MTQAVTRAAGDVSGATSDEALVELWLAGRPETTQRAYRHAYASLRAFTPVPLRELTYSDVTAYASVVRSLDLAPMSVRLYLAAVKSLLTFAERLGYVTFNVARPLRLPPEQTIMPDRVLERDDILAMISTAESAQEALIMRLLYLCGLRVSELCALTWGDVVSRKNGGAQLTVRGKGDYVRFVLLPPRLAADLLALKPRRRPAMLIFHGSRVDWLGPREVRRMIARAALRVGLIQKVSPHWFRHAHITDSLDAGAPMHVIQATVGHKSLGMTGRYAHARPTESSATFLED